MSLKIGLVLSSVPPYSETFFHNKINGLAKKGFVVYLFAKGKTLDNLKCIHIKPFPIFRFASANVIVVAFVAVITCIRCPGRVVKYVKTESREGTGWLEIIKGIYSNAHIIPIKLDWLHFGFATLAISKENLALAMGAKMSVSFRGFDINVYPVKFPHCYDKVWQKVNKVHSISKYLYHNALMLGLREDTPYEIIYPAINPENGVSRSASLDSKSLTIVTIARLNWIKGLEYSIQAMKDLKESNIKFKYLIVGEGTEYEKLLFEIHQLGLSDCVQLLGKKSVDHTQEILSQADIYLQPSLSEGFCNSVLEAQKCGCLCIVSNTGGLVENIEDGVTGWLVEPRSARQISEKVKFTISLSKDNQDKIRNTARKRVLDQFNLDLHTDFWAGFYSK